MANNRMYLTCCKCNPSGEAFDGDGDDSCILAKYFPSSGWYPTTANLSPLGLVTWLAKHRHGDTSPLGLEIRFRIGYEDDVVPNE